MRDREFGCRLMELRRENKLKKKDITAFIAANQPKKFTIRAYQAYESGYHYPSSQTLIALSDLYDVSIDYLLGRTEDRTRYTPANKRTSFADRSCMLRKARNLTQGDVAIMQGKNRSGGPRVSLQEKGQHIPRCATLTRMADHYNVSMDYLLGITDTKRRHTVKQEGVVIL